MNHKKDRFLAYSIIGAAVVVGGALLFSVFYSGGYKEETSPSAPQAAAASGDVSKVGPRDAVLGDSKAPVTYVDYGDYQCPFCNKYFSETEPAIISQYVNTGKVKMLFRDFAFLGPESLAAANAAQCANDQGKLWPYHDALYTAKSGDFNAGGSENDGFLNRTLFLKLASQVGLNVPSFTTCIDSNAHADVVAQEKTDAATVGVGATPTFFINGSKVEGAESFASLQNAIEQALASK